MCKPGKSFNETLFYLEEIVFDYIEVQSWILNSVREIGSFINAALVVHKYGCFPSKNISPYLSQKSMKNLLSFPRYVNREFIHIGFKQQAKFSVNYLQVAAAEQSDN